MMDIYRRAALRPLWVASVLGGLGQSLPGAAAALLARQFGNSDAAAGLPQALLVAGAGGAAFGISRLSARHGRRAALSAAAGVAIAGCGASVLAAVTSSLVLLLAGSLLLGAGNAAVLLGRYAAAELVPEGHRARAMSSVLTATTAGAVAGPNLLAWSAALARGTGIPPLAGSFAVAACAFALAAAILLAFLPPALGRAQSRESGSGGLDVSPPLEARGLAGLTVLTTANLIMMAVMTMAPMQLQGAGADLTVIGLVVSVHIAGMFAPSPVSGWLTDRFGAWRVAVAAAAVLIAACALAAVAAQVSALLALAMALVGIGWNLALLSGSTLLTAGVPAALRPRREGRGDATMNVAAAAGSAAAGPLMAAMGYAAVAGAGALCGIVPAVAALASRPGRRPGRGGVSPRSARASLK